MVKIDMPMPDGCIDCRFHISSEDSCGNEIFHCPYLEEDIKYRFERLDNCPLQEDNNEAQSDEN